MAESWIGPKFLVVYTTKNEQDLVVVNTGQARLPGSDLLTRRIFRTRNATRFGFMSDVSVLAADPS